MKQLFEIKDVDRKFYEEHLQAFLPERIIDIHTHVWLAGHRSSVNAGPGRTVTWPQRVARENPIEDLLDAYRLLLPGKSVTPLIFGNCVSASDDYSAGNDYVASVAHEKGLPALLWTFPHWTALELEQLLIGGGFLGIKSYLSLTPEYLPEKEIRIFDIFPHTQLELMDHRGGIVMLHIPRDGRLRDPVNLAQLLEIEARYANIKLIVAHAGRAYCPEDVGDAFKVLAKTNKMMFDISANTNETVFKQLIDAVGPKRILFGSDMPITRMRMRRICEKGNYVNLVPKGRYGDVSGDRHMREVSGPEAARLTLFLYEELDAFRRAAEAAGLTHADIESIFHQNAACVLDAVKPSGKQQLKMIWPEERLKSPPTWELPEGYSLRTFKYGDGSQYIRLMRLAGFSGWNEDHLNGVLKRALPNGLFFAAHNQTGALVATCVALNNPAPAHPAGGELGWVAADSEHKGKGLGFIVCAAVTKRLMDAGYTDIRLHTDDFRLPAIRTYIKLGWAPALFAPDMEARWKDVFQKLNMSRGNG